MLTQEEMDTLRELMSRAELNGQLVFFLGKIRLELEVDPESAIYERKLPYIEEVSSRLDETTVESFVIHLQDVGSDVE